MSIILEALRKAEASRREPDRSELATPTSPHVPLRARVPLWLLPVGAAGIVSVSLGAYVLWPESGEQTANVRATAPPAAASAAAEPRATASRTMARAETSSQSAATAAGGTPLAKETTSADTTAGTNPTGGRSSADVRSLALEARGAQANASPSEGAEPGAQGRTLTRGSVEVRDLMSAQVATAPSHPGVKPGTVEVRDLLAEQGAAPVAPDDEGAPAPATGGGPATRSQATAPAAGNAPAAQAPAASAPPPAKTAPAVPLIDELVANGELNPPDLSLEMHAYGPDPASRFVYINMRRYHIGDTTREGAVIEDITPEGAVLLLQGRRFLLESH